MLDLSEISPLTVSIACIAVVVGLLITTGLFRKSRGVPHVSGWPVVGSLPAFIAGAVEFVDRHRQLYGGTFSTMLLSQPVVFLTNVYDHAALYRSKKEADMHEFAIDITANVCGVSAATAEKIDDSTTKGLYVKHLMGSGLAATLPGLTSEVDTLLSPTELSRCSAESGPVELYDWLSRRLFKAGLHAVLGAALDADALYPHFQALDADFPLLSAGAPSFLFRKTVRARAAITEALMALETKEAVVPDLTLGPFQPTVSPMVRARQAHFSSKGISAHDNAAMTVVLVWALHANSAPALFWAAAHVYSDPATLSAIRSEIAAAAPLLTPSRIASTDLDAALPLLTSATWEALRLYAHSFSMRTAKQDFELPLKSPSPAEDAAQQSLRLSKGDRVIVVPAHHRDASIFSSPQAFVADRFVTPRPGSPAPSHAALAAQGGASSHPVRPFGGGDSLCPGRALALAEVRLFLASLIDRVDLEPACDPAKSQPVSASQVANIRAAGIVSASASLDASSDAPVRPAPSRWPSLPLPDLKRAGLGVIPPKSPLWVRVQLRRKAD